MDIDIDLKTDFRPDRVFKNITFASMAEGRDLKKHPNGAYFQDIPRDPFTKLAAIPYKNAEEFGFKKIDFLHLNLLKPFESKAEVLAAMRREPNWKLLESREFVEGKQLFHLSGQFDIVSKVKPKSIMEVADVLALIRPNKRLLVDKYIRNKAAVRPVLYHKVDPSDLRKAHAVAYAHNVVIHMNILELGIEI